MEKSNLGNALKDKCEDKVAHAYFIEDELSNAFRKIKKLKKWIKAVENRCDVMRINSFASN